MFDFDPEKLRRVSERDQMDRAMNDMAEMMAAYYHHLVSRDVPTSVAGQLTVGFQQTCAALVAAKNQRDRE